MYSFCVGCNLTACIGESCPRFPRFWLRYLQQGATIPNVNITFSTVPDDLKRYGTCNEGEVATLDRIHELEAQLAEARTAITDLLAASLPTIGGEWSEAVERAKEALSGDTMQIEQDARIGRAAEEWLTTTLRQVAKDGFAPHTSPAAVIVTLQTIIAQAKGGEHA
jgi:hypothetical protein